MRTKFIFFLFLVLMLTIGGNVYQFFSGPNIETVNCESPIFITSHQKGYHFSGTIGVTLNPEGSGAIAYSGEITGGADGGNYSILRIVYFNYTIDYFSYLTLTDFVIKKNVNDNIEDAKFDKLIFDFHDKTRRVRVEKLSQTAYLLQNAFNPIFVCIKK